MNAVRNGIVNPALREQMRKLTKSSESATRTVGTRYPLDRIALLDAIAIRRKHGNRAELIEAVLDELVESEFPGATSRAA